MTRRAGAVSVSELLLVFWGFALVLLALAEFVAGQGRLARGQRDLVRLREAHRTVEIILSGEIRELDAPDLVVDEPGALAVRAPRGSGPLCSAEEGTVSLRYRGARRPDPEKDSVLLLSGGGGEEVRGLVAVSGGGCAGGGLTLALDGPAAPDPRFAVVFEPGSYHAADGAIRYRLGRAGRQPVTETIFRRAAFAPGLGAAGLLVHLEAHADSFSRRVHSPVTLPIASLNPLPR